MAIKRDLRNKNLMDFCGRPRSPVHCKHATRNTSMDISSIYRTEIGT
jgi:hypothetical protein